MLFSKNRRFLFIGILIAISILVSLLSLGVGSAEFNPFTAILDFIYGESSISSTILFKIRFPRVLLAFGVGGALSISGVLLQGLFRNDLVEPYTLGISGGASLGVATAIALGLKSYFYGQFITVAGFIGAIVSIALVYTISSRSRKITTGSMLLAGVMVSFISSSLVMFIMATSKSEDLQGIIFWIMGSLDTTDINISLYFLLFSFIILIASFYYTRLLNALQIGEEEAFYLGFDIQNSKKIIFILASMLTGVAVSLAGVIGFVGLVIPHLMRSLSGTDNRFLLFSSFFAGASFLVISDTIARVIISPLELPVGVITGIIGGGLFVYAIWKGKLSL
ncbi:MAG: iron ABC transporter permease [Candidatus Delongbacteria bacterium]|nr:MAG: iron ABC transporter permease [Candidatus Delongbacteria bacterium]